MELYTLDGLLRRTELIEGYESFLWTERYSELGDLQIVTPSTQQYRNLLASGTFIGMSESDRVMKIETIEDAEDATDGSKKFSVFAKEITDVTNDRVAETGVVGEQSGTWRAIGKPSDIIRALFDYGCRNGLSDPTDQLPLLVAGSLYPVGNLPEILDEFVIERETGTLFAAMKEIADVWDLGFRMYKGMDTGTLYFDVYTGNDRTTSQSILPPVIFSPDLDTLQGVSELTSVSNSKNVARVSNEHMSIVVYGEGASETTSGFAKRVMYVNASDIQYLSRENEITDDQQKAINKAVALKEALEEHKIAMQKLISKTRLAEGEADLITAFITASTPSLITAGEKTLIDSAVIASTALEEDETILMLDAMIQRGKEELAKNRSISAFDGEITQLSPYKYNRDYGMGDLVEMRNTDGLTNQMMVTEQIFAADSSGERAFPTLTIRRFITPGSWLAWENTQVWQDAPGVWAEA